MTDLSSRYPQHEKLTAISTQSQTIGEFVDWLASEKGIHLAHHIKFDEREDEQLSSLGIPPIQQLLADFFGIDYDELMREKDRMLEVMRAAQS